MNLKKYKCSTCKRMLGRPNYAKRATRPGRDIAYVCRACSAAGYQARKDQHAAYMRDWYLRNREQARANSDAWIAANKEQYAEASRKRRRIAPHVHQQRDARRRAMEVDAFVEDVQRDVVWIRDGGLCRLCGEAADPSDWHLEHLTPLARGGLHCYENAAVSHPFCNKSKGARTLSEFLDWSATRKAVS